MSADTIARTGPGANADSPTGPQPTSRRRRRRAWWLYGVMVVLAVPLVFPTWWMVTSSLLPANEVLAYPPKLFPTNPQWDNYRRAFVDYPLAHQYVNSLYIAVLVTLGTMVVASLSGYAFARLRLPGANWLFLVVLTGLLVPSEVTIIPLFKLMDRLHLIDTHWPLIVIPIFGAPSVLGAFVMRQFFLALPDELEEAGRLDGLGPFGVFRRIALPLARPALSAVAIFTFMNTWNYFLEPLVYLTSKDKYTLPLALTQYTDAYGTQLWNIQLAASATTVIPVLIVFVVAQRQFVEGLAQTGLKG
ncbi:carbohydrate ABC transporter permease [Phycicoccus sp. M110.8]|uniref:carbohydrate ABC transporter permease n=1 Tax=Phycicoccus sp. M110.8 TaxID=3075433 RepID=UPI0028FD3D10|nr:carbohydrate ABC transporter permease [Phycicoccus sp. M110.8]MDU0315043.1 carbohydrate ABC transporter permease [Phycicoccus sp. M110.8]